MISMRSRSIVFAPLSQSGHRAAQPKSQAQPGGDSSKSTVARSLVTSLWRQSPWLIPGTKNAVRSPLPASAGGRRM